MAENLIDLITEEMATDYDNMARQSQRLIDLYQRAPAEGRALLDRAFVSLCGWSLKTLIAKLDDATDAAEPDDAQEA